MNGNYVTYDEFLAAASNAGVEIENRSHLLREYVTPGTEGTFAEKLVRYFAERFSSVAQTAEQWKVIIRELLLEAARGLNVIDRKSVV